MSHATGCLLSINIARESMAQNWTESGNRTGIHKISTPGPIRFADNCVQGDTVVDRKHHGGYDMAVYAYAREDAVWWEAQIGREIVYGQFGENLTTEGIDVTGALIGERWRIGEVVLEVSAPRIPCRVFSGFWDRPTLIKEFTEANRPGAYLRIIEEGTAAAGATIEVIYKPDHAITIGDLFAAKSGERSKITEIAKVAELSDSYREWAERVAQSAH